MRHNKKFNHLGRPHSHRELMLSNMAVSLIMHKRIRTTVAKAKALRVYVEPIMTRTKKEEVAPASEEGKNPKIVPHQRRMAFADLRDKYAVQELFEVIKPAIADRPGGYTRIVRTGRRQGDNAEMCMIELVDFNPSYSQNRGSRAGEGKRSTRRSTRRGRGGKSTAAQATEPAAEESKE